MDDPTADKAELPAVDAWLTAAQLGAEFMSSEASVQDWMKAGYIPRRFIGYCVPVRRRRRRLYHPALVSHLGEVFAFLHQKRTAGSAA